MDDWKKIDENTVYLDGHFTKVVDYKITYNYSDDERNISVTKTDSARDDSSKNEFTELINKNFPSIKDMYFTFSVDNFEVNDDEITVNLKAENIRYSVIYDGEETKHNFLEQVTVKSDSETVFLINDVPIKKGKSFTFYVTGNMEITTDPDAEIKNNATLIKTNSMVNGDKIELEMLATATADSFKRMGVAFARYKTTNEAITSAVLDVATGSAISGGVAVSNSKVKSPNSSGQYQYRYNPYMNSSLATGSLYFYTFCVTEDDEVIISGPIEIDLDSILA